MDEGSQQDAICKECRQSIPQGARLCSTCNSYQDWRRWFPISSTVLALLTALVSVLSLSIPTIIDLVRTPWSDAYLSMPSLDGTTLRVLAINHGDAPATLIRAKIRSDYLAPATKIKLRNEEDAIIRPGSKLLVFNVVPLLSEGQSYRGSLEMLQKIAAKKYATETAVEFEIAQSDGTLQIVEFPLHAWNLFDLLRANADRCSAIDVPNFLNGCIGTGAPLDDQASQSSSSQSSN